MMEALIRKANFAHNNEDQKDKFKEEIDEWYDNNEEKFSFQDGIKSLKALSDALSGKKIPSHKTEGWEQAETAYEYIQRMIDKLKDDGKVQQKDVQEAFFNFILQLSSANLASIHMQLIRNVYRESDIALKEYLEEQPKEKVKTLLEICKRKPVEEPENNEPIFELYYLMMRDYVEDLLPKEQVQDFQLDLVEFTVRILLCYDHLDNDSLGHVADLSDRIMRDLDDPYKKTTDFASVKRNISMIQDYFARSGDTPEKLHRQIRESIRTMSKELAGRCLVDEFGIEFHDLAMAVAKSPKSKKKHGEFIQDCFNACILFFRELPNDVLKKKTGPFKQLVQKFHQGLTEISPSLLEDYPERMTDALQKIYPKNKQYVDDWFALLLPLLKLPFVSAMDAARDVVEAAKGMEWKGKAEMAEKVFKAAESVQIPEFKHLDEKKRNDKREGFAKYFKYFLKDFLEGLNRAKLGANFGTQALRMCTNLLKQAGDFEELQGLVEDVSEKIEINVKEPQSKQAIIDTMKALIEISKNPDYPWVDCWYFERAVKELVRACVRPINDPRVFTDDDLVVFISLCEETLSHDVMDPETGQFSSQHYRVFMEVMDGLSTWMKTLDKYAPAKNLFDQIMATYETEEPNIFILNSRYLGDASGAPSGLKILAAHLDTLFTLMVENESSDLVRTVYQAYPSNPKAIAKHMPALMTFYTNSFDDSVISFMSMMLHQATKSAPEVFTKENSKQILDKCSANLASQSSILQVVQELCKRRPEIMVQHMPTLMDKSKWQSMMKSWINDMIATLALYDEKLAPKALDYMLEEARVEQDKASLITSMNAARQIGFKYKDLIKARRDKVEQLQFADPDAQNLKQITLDLIDGKTSEEMMQQFEEQQANIAGLVGRVDEIEEDVAEMKTEVGRQGQDLNTVKKDVNQQGQRLDQVEETVEETVAKVEEIDQKTLSHSPYWSRDVAKLLNPATDHDWRLLSSRLGYSNDDIRAWAQQADPCMAMLNEWYATRKTSEATLAILTQLQEMNRQDAAIIVENAMKNAEAVVEDEDFEYASPPPVFISYQWGHQPEARLLQKHLEMAGYQCWLDLGQMGGGDKLFEKIDSGIRAAKVVISCVTEKYAKSPNCNREVNLSVSLNKSMIPLLMEKCTWPPPGSMGPIFSEYLFIRFFQRGGEELPDERYWPEAKFQELLMQLDVMGLQPDETQIEPVYRDWWIPKVQEIKIDKSKTKDGGSGPKTNTADMDKKAAESPDVFISYQWGKQKNIIQLYERLTGLGLTCWLDIKQMGGGDSLYDKIDRGLRGCRVVVSCVTNKYSLSPNCRREVSLADALKKPLVPLLLESMQWPPAGPMSMAFTQLLYIDFTKDESEQMIWTGVKSQELIDKLNQHVPMIEQPKNDGSTTSQTGGHVENTETHNKGEEQVVNQNSVTALVKRSSDESVENYKNRNVEADKKEPKIPTLDSFPTNDQIKDSTKEKGLSDKENSDSEDIKQPKHFQVEKVEEFRKSDKPVVVEKSVVASASKTNERLKETEKDDLNSSDKENQKNVNLNNKSTRVSGGMKRNRTDKKGSGTLFGKEQEKRKLELKREDEEKQRKRKWEGEKEKLWKQEEAQKEEERKRNVEKRRLERRKEFDKQQRDNEKRDKRREASENKTDEKDKAQVSENGVGSSQTLSKASIKRPKPPKETKPLPPPSQFAAEKQNSYLPFTKPVAREVKKKPQQHSDNLSAGTATTHQPDSQRSTPRAPNEAGNNKPKYDVNRDSSNNRDGQSSPHQVEKPRKRTPKPPPSQQGKASRFDPFSSQASKKAAKEPSPKPKQTATSNPNTNGQVGSQKQDKEPNGAPQQKQQPQQPQQKQEKQEPQRIPQQQPQKQDPKPTPAQQPQREQPQKPKPESPPNPPPPPQEPPKKSKTCAII